MRSLYDPVLFGLLGLAAVGVVVLVMRGSKGKTSRPIILSIFGALALAVTWGTSAGYVGVDGWRQAELRSASALLENHEHDEMFADDGGLVSSEMLAEHLSHLRETDLIVTDEQQAAAKILTTATRQATKRYADLAWAQTEGYAALTDSDSDNERDLTYLYDQSFVKAGTWIEPGRPQALIYLRSPDTGHQLVGVAFLTPAGEGPRLGGGLTIWFPHRAMCLDAQQSVAARAVVDGRCPAGTHSLAWRPEALYVWLFDNPNGSFAGGLSREAAEVARRWRVTG